MVKKALIICYSHHASEPRVVMEVKALKSKFQITTAGFSGCNDSEVQFLEVTKDCDKPLFTFHIGLPLLARLPFTLANRLFFRFTGRTQKFSRKDFLRLSKENYDIIICHHPETMNLAVKLKSKTGCKLIFNAHEIYPFEFGGNTEWMTINYSRIDGILRAFLPYFEYIFTVNDEIANWYRLEYSINTVAVHNSKPYNNISPSLVHHPIRIIHHGGAMPQRKLEDMAEAVLACDGKYEMTFMLVETNHGYLKYLREKYQSRVIKFLPPVAYGQIIEAISEYDIGLYILPNDSLNHQLALPNKVFEFLQARLAIVTSPNKGLSNFVLRYQLGKVSRGFEIEDMVALLLNLEKSEIQKCKENANMVALDLSSERDEEMILYIVNKIIFS